MRFSLWILPIATVYCLVINDYDIPSQSDLDGVINNYDEPPQSNLDGSQLDLDDTSNPLQGTLGNPSASSPPPDSKPSNNELIAQSVTGLFWDGIVAPIARGAWTGLVEALSWDAAGASVLKHEVFDQSAAANKERVRVLQSAIETVRKQGCRAARWGFLYCGFGPLGPMMFPGVYTSVWNVWLVGSRACSELTALGTPPPVYCCADMNKLPWKDDYNNLVAVGKYCVDHPFVPV